MSDVERKVWEKRSDAARTINEYYNNYSNIKELIIPVSKFTINGRDVHLIDSIINYFKEQGYYKTWRRDDVYYKLTNLDHNRLLNFFKDINSIYKKYAFVYQQKHPNLNNVSKERCVINKNTDGYFYKGGSIKMNKNTIYYHIFNIIYSANPTGGYIEYEEIENQLREKGFQPLEDLDERNKRINNAVHNKNSGLFRFAKVNKKSLGIIYSDIDLLISIRRGYGLEFHNNKLT